VGGAQRGADLKVGICGEHGGEPSSVEFFHETGLDYVSCSPFRVPSRGWRRRRRRSTPSPPCSAA
jgi:phosphoenolpyruvate synthase/pyruvate phosphate dikinase